MTARLISVAPESSPAPRIGRCPQNVAGTTSSLRRSASKGTVTSLGRSEKTLPSHAYDLPLLWKTLVDSLPEGVMVVSRDLTPVYINEKARTISQKLLGTDVTRFGLPLVISEVCHRLLRSYRLQHNPLVVEYQTETDQILRIRAHWLPAAVPPKEGMAEGAVMPTHMLVFLEDRHEFLREELRIEQKKYDLTDRESEIWMLLRQEYTYQEIAALLQISLNTVKTHVKNVYAKKRSCQGQEKLWCSD